MAEKVKENAQDKYYDIREAAVETGEYVIDKVDEAKEFVEEESKILKDNLKKQYENVKETAEDIKETVEEKVLKAGKQAKGMQHSKME